MGKVLIFGGTTEGRQAALNAATTGQEVTVCVTSTYARALLPANMNCHVGVLDEKAMLAFIREQQPERIIDATHPFAARATQTIFSCAQQLDVPLKRILRPKADSKNWQHDVQWVQDTKAAVNALMSTQGNVLLTTGSHTVNQFAENVDSKRLYVRTLPTVDAINLCLTAGILPSHIIAMQGPFSQNLNGALYDQLDICTMVSKDSGTVGGVEEKVLPALERDIHVIMIQRPKEAHHAR